MIHQQQQVQVRGSGIAASCCHVLLTRAGMRVNRHAVSRPLVPAILISPGTRDLLEDVLRQPNLFLGLPVIRKRVVAWGSAHPVTVPHEGVVISELDLLQRFDCDDTDEPADDAPSWTIETLPSKQTPQATRASLTRSTTATRVRLAADADKEACLVESVTRGWLFLMPTGDEFAWLLSCGDPPRDLLQESRLVTHSVVELNHSSGTFGSDPRINDPLCSANWLACGSAAIRFDPLCGDGSGNAVREAILACAVIRHTDPKTSPEELGREYTGRLHRGFGRHIEFCHRFYETGGEGEWWQEQTQLLKDMLQWLDKQSQPHQSVRFQLLGYDLHRVSR